MKIFAKYIHLGLFADLSLKSSTLGLLDFFQNRMSQTILDLLICISNMIKKYLSLSVKNGFCHTGGGGGGLCGKNVRNY